MTVWVLGSINLDVVQQVARLPRPGETVLSLGGAAFLGGKGANQAVASARMGADTRFLGAVGDDAASAELLGRLGAEGVEVSAVVRKTGEAAGAAYICVDPSGENTIVVAGGANGTLQPGDLPEPAGGSVFLSQLETPVETVRAFLSSAAARAGIRVLNAAPALPEAADLLPLADIVIVNETELALFAGLDHPPAGAEACAAAARALRRGGQTLVVTLGSDGAMAVGPEGEIRAAGRKAQAVDATGAGDCFCGVLAAALSQGQPLPKALRAANAAAALSVGRPGASASMPTAQEVALALQGA